MANVGDFVGDIVGLGQDVYDTAVGGIASIGQDVYNNTVGLASDPGNILGAINALANLTGRTNPVTAPLSMAYNFAAQGEKDKNLGINNPSLLGRGLRSLVPGFVQKPVFDALGVTGDHSFDGYGSPEAQEEGVAGIDTSGTNPNAAIGGSEFSMDGDGDTTDTSTDTTDTSTDTTSQTEDDYDGSDDYARGGAVGFWRGGMNAPPRRKRESSGKGIERSNRGMVWKFAEGNVPAWMKGVLRPKDYSLKFNSGVSADVRVGVAGDMADVNLGVDERILGRNLRGDVTIPTKQGLLKFLVDREINNRGDGVTTTGASLSAPVLGGILSAEKRKNPHLDSSSINYAKDFGDAGRVIAGMQEVNDRRALQAAYERDVLGGQGRVNVERTPDGETSVMGRLSFPLN